MGCYQSTNADVFDSRVSSPLGNPSLPKAAGVPNCDGCLKVCASQLEVLAVRPSDGSTSSSAASHCACYSELLEADFSCDLTLDVSRKELDKLPVAGPKWRKGCKVRNFYTLTRTLGTGGSSVVKLAIEKATSKAWACKIMTVVAPGSPASNIQNTWDKVFKEIDIMAGLEHDNIVLLKEYFVEGSEVFIITELLTGGDLLESLQWWDRFSEDMARRFFVDLLKGLEYLHHRGVVHRDIKLENVLLVKKEDTSRVKIADFGLAKERMFDDAATACGTPQYIAPEIAKGLNYGSGVDLWSAGVVLFTVLSGYLPFHADSRPKLFHKIQKAEFDFDDPVWDCVSPRAKDLICKLLEVDPTKRLTASQALQHEWLTLPAVSFARPLMGDFTPCDEPVMEGCGAGLVLFDAVPLY